MLHTYPRASAHTLLKATLSTLGFCGALLATSAAHAQGSTIKIEAEASTNTIAGTGLVLATDLTPFSGTGYLNFNGNSPANSLKVTIPVTVTTGGAYILVIRYESQYGTTQAGYGKVGAYSVNGGPLNQVYFNGTAPGIGTANFKNTSAIRIALNSGANSIVISDNGFGYFGVDYITLAPATATTALTPSAAGRVEAEAGQLNYLQSLVRDDDMNPYSGTGYVSTFSTSTPSSSAIVLPVTVATAGVYQVAVGARHNVTDAKSFDLAVKTATSAGSPLTTQIAGTTSTTAFTSFVVGNYNMTAGTNTITITSQTSYIDVDYVDITPTTNVVTAARASAEAQKALSAYPTPTNGQALNVNLELAAAQETTFDLVNALGQRVSTATRSLRAGSNQLQLPTAGLTSGLYQLVVRGGDQPLLVQRVVIN